MQFDVFENILWGSSTWQAVA